MSDAPALPFHFVWRSGAETHTLAAAAAMVENSPEAAAYHLREGHLQTALTDQGYGVVAEGLSGADAVPMLGERLRIALELHRTWWAEHDGSDDLAKAFTTLGRVLRGRGKDLLHESRKHLVGFRSWLADAIRSK